MKKNNITIPEKSKFVKMDIHYFIIEILPLNEKLLKVKIITNMNPKLKVIPYSLLNFMTRKVEFFFNYIYEKIF